MNSAAHHFVTDEGSAHTLNVIVDGMHCPSCVALIENTLKKQHEIINARLNLSTKRLKITWEGAREMADQWVSLINQMGYYAVPFDAETSETFEKREENFLLRCLAAAGFASGNLMLFSVPLWSSDMAEMGETTRTFFHWVQAVIAIPAIIYCGKPFYRSAWNAIKQWKTNMDVPISVAVILASLMSLFETITFGRHSYFDSAVMLLFFLLVGRYLEARARGRARGAAHDLLQMMKGVVTVVHAGGMQENIPLSDIAEGMELLVAAGEKVGADGEVLSGTSEIDMSLITGESLPQAVEKGHKVFAGTINLSAPIRVRVTGAHERSLIAEIMRIMETAEQSQAKYVTLADRISCWYTPAVHALAAMTFIGWVFLGHAPWQVALLYAATVLIITCPCALGLAVPVVQVLASGKLLRSGILLKSGSALERLSSITHVVFDKTGTLTLGKPEMLAAESYAETELQLAASLARKSRHPLSQAIFRAYSGELLQIAVKEVAGYGLEAMYEGKQIRVGKRNWCAPDAKEQDNLLELWLAMDGTAPVRFTFADQLRSDAKKIIHDLQRNRLHTSLLSGDRTEIALKLAKDLDINHAAGELLPVEKTQYINTLQTAGAKVLMVGDGLNDAPSLASADVSMSPSSAIDITQNAADLVFQGEKLKPVMTAWRFACFSQKLVKENFALAIFYNLIAIPLAVFGYVTPLVAAVAMSSSSLIVIANAMRLNMIKE